MSGVRRYMHISPLCEAAPLLMANYPMATEYVLASDYDRDTQALKERLSDRALDQMRQLEELIECQAERDELASQLGAMRALLTDARRYVDKAWPDGVHSYRANSVSGDLLSKIDAALQEDKP